MIEIEVSGPVFRFLGEYFHQDIDTPESALDEYLGEIPKEEQETDIDYSDEEKNDFIDEAADGVDILSYGVSPIIWLEQVIQKIEKNIETL